MIFVLSATLDEEEFDLVQEEGDGTADKPPAIKWFIVPEKISFYHLLRTNSTKTIPHKKKDSPT